LDLSILDIDADYLTASMPDSYKEAGLECVCGQVDGKDFMTWTPRTSTVLSRAANSNKMGNHSAARVITWTTAAGLTYEHTDVFLARVTEKKLVELWGPRLAKCPRGWVMLADRGFHGTAHYYPNFNAQLTPCFLSKRSQFDTEDVMRDYEICRLRYTCEVAFSRLNAQECTRDVIPFKYFSVLKHMIDWGHANMNLRNPLQKPGSKPGAEGGVGGL
jgi:hypothetical protein